MVALRRRFRSDPAALVPVGEAAPPAADEHAPASTELEFSAYAEDCRVFGFLRVSAERLSDELNRHDEYELLSALVVALADGRATEMQRLTLQRGEVLAVRSAGPRGNPARRSRKRPSPVTVKSGPYLIHGYLHAPPGADPLVQIRRRKPMVPLTDAWMEYQASAQYHRVRVGTIIINRELVDWVNLSRDAEIRVVGLPLETSLDAQAKDMTGYIRTPADD